MFTERLFLAIIVAFVLPIVLTIAEDAKQTGTAAPTPVSGKKGAFDEEAEHEDEPNIPGSSGGGTSLVSTKTKTKRKACLQPPYTSSFIVGHFNDSSRFAHSRPVGHCECSGEFTREFYASARSNIGRSTVTHPKTGETKYHYQLDVHVKALCGAEGTNLSHGLCVCAEQTNECFRFDERSSVPIGDAVALSYCDSDGCHMYFGFVPSDPAKFSDEQLQSIHMVGDQGSMLNASAIFSVSRCDGFCTINSASSHLKIAAMSCDGCEGIKKAHFDCFGPTSYYESKPQQCTPATGAFPPNTELQLDGRPERTEFTSSMVKIESSKTG